MCFVVPEERAVFMREQASSLYSVSAYFLSKLLADMPFHFALPLEMGAITYFLIGFNTEEDAGSKFLIFCNILPLFSLLQ
jgi:hypothetical protein